MSQGLRRFLFDMQRGMSALTLLLMLSSCASSAIVHLDSSPPQAKISVKPLGTGAFKEFGETPLSLPSSQIEEGLNGSGPVTVTFSKHGYREKEILLSDISQLNQSVKVNLEPLSSLEDPSLVNAQIEAIFEVQRLIRVKKFEEALKVIAKLKTEAPHLSAPYEMEGGIYFVKGQLAESLDSYRNAVRLNPKSVEAIRMRDMIAAQSIGASSAPRAPASTGADQ